MTGNAAPVAGVYRVTTQGVLPQSIRILIPVPSFRTMLLMLIAVDANIAVRWSTGPEYFRRGQAPKPEGSFSTRSDSKRSSVNQSRFRTAVIARDGTCLLTDVDYDNCTACHIVPFSRFDVYEDILSVQNEIPLFYASCGFLLRDDLHHAFDRLEFSFHLKDNTFYVHFFILNFPGAESIHGKAISPERFRGSLRRRPDPRLVRWHYRQCVMAHIRGFAFGMGDTQA